MTRSLITLLLFAQSFYAIGQVQIEYYKAKKFECVIFPADSYGRPPHETFTPLRSEIDRAEKTIRSDLTDLIDKKNYRNRPLVDRHLSQYYRQYKGYIGFDGSKILSIRFLPKENPEVEKRWTKESLFTDIDGFWMLEYNLTTNSLGELYIKDFE